MNIYIYIYTPKKYTESEFSVFLKLSSLNYSAVRKVEHVAIYSKKEVSYIVKQVRMINIGHLYSMKQQSKITETSGH